jgi:hypothetical protein
MFNDTEFASYTINNVPQGLARIADNGSTSSITRDSVKQRMCNSISLNLDALNFMTRRNGSFMMGGDDIALVTCRTIALIFEHARINQQLLNARIQLSWTWC